MDVIVDIALQAALKHKYKKSLQYSTRCALPFPPLGDGIEAMSLLLHRGDAFVYLINNTLRIVN